MNSFRKLRSLPGNVRFSLLALALWGIPNSLINSYATLYMLEQGLSASQVGIINSICYIIKTALAFFSGYIINKLGRRITAGVIDLIGWGVYMCMLASAHDFRMFMTASLINCITVVGEVATNCFMAEDVSQKDRVVAYNFSTIVSSSCAFLVPISGLLINRFSLVPAMRGLYLFACISMSLAALCKLFLLKETSVGKGLMAHGRNIKNPFARLPEIIKYIVGNKKLMLLLSLNILLLFATTINNIYYVPYLAQQLGFSELLISFFPFVSTAIGLVVCFRIVPRINMVKGMITGVLLDTLGILMLFMAAFTFKELAYLCVILKAVGAAMMGPVLSTLIANNLKDELRTDVYGVFNTFTMLCMFPAGYLGGYLFDSSPVYLVGLLLCVYVIGLFMLIHTNKKVGL